MISIHAPLTGSDTSFQSCSRNTKNFNPRSPHRERLIRRNKLPELVIFQSTLPSQGATRYSDSSAYTVDISIHAPLTGSDRNADISTRASLHFNPRSPHRERLSGRVDSFNVGKFQSTLPSQGATANIHIKFLCDLLFSTLSSKNSFTLSRFPQTIT